MKILGLMSGTSGDGIDGVTVEFAHNGDMKILWHKSYHYSEDIFKRVKQLIKNASAQDIALGHSYISELYYLACRNFFENEKVLPDYIAAHGQTVWHEPSINMWGKIPVRGTLQLLDPTLLSYKTGLPVICDFRKADMAVGGQGAPLVPFADKKIFQKYCKPNRVFIALNVGGMANVTVLKGNESKAEVISAFDTGPGNALIDEYMQLNNLGNYDYNGELAKSGKTNHTVLNELLKDPYFSKKPPKSTGREYFTYKNFSNYFKDMTHSGIVSTLLDLSVFSIIKSCENYLKLTDTICVAGGGAFNLEFMKRLKDLCKKKGINCVTSEYFGIPVMAREALAFAILGYSYLIKEPSNVTVATGASKSVVLGYLTKV